MKPRLTVLAARSVLALALLGFATCSNHNGPPGDGGQQPIPDGGVCSPGALGCSGNVAQTCSAAGQWVNGQTCAGTCNAGVCSGGGSDAGTVMGVCTPGSGQCYGTDDLQTCGSNGLWGKITACPFGCASGACRTTCNTGDFHCAGNTVEKCTPPTGWTPTGTTCDPSAGQKCDEQTGTCQVMTPTGSPTPTGEYYQYAVFNQGSSPFLGGYDVDSYGDYIFVNRGGQYLDQYQVTLSSANGKPDPNQHPDNPQDMGPIVPRTLTLVKTWTTAQDMVPLGPASAAELFAQADRVDMLNTMSNGSISEFVLATNAASVLIPPVTSMNTRFEVMGHGDADGRWYVGTRDRRVYSYDPTGKSWVAEFSYPNLAGSHMDGMEVVVSPGSGEQYVYVSDMTSDFIAQYQKSPTGWVQKNVFKYKDNTSSNVEGMGFGALNHFWATSGTILYELGGGDLQTYLQCPPGVEACTNNAGCSNGQSCVNGCCQNQIQ